MKVSVYRNLHNGLISIKSASSGLVLGHAKSVDISGADFVVNEAGRQRVLRDKQKNVHAYVKGLLLDTRGFMPYKGRSLQRCTALGAIHSTYKDTVVSYNPYKAPHFVIKGTSDKVSKAKLCTVSHDGTISGFRIE
tara:strand:+ start:228 stop:635 length:408 start_codon:yes stop_codon:yes gene_type:complete